ncbi:hypothetical protein Tco_0894560 [Tanacetum coccineum]|uniref:Retrovirus-related Pol polyprotein from transposon TNT 1-94-like beta-barrel domain-containing protein n=1 Tax=Tanacetum coccineum TaxID=301880 RepID=A0ABQ5CDD5_9ASTR
MEFESAQGNTTTAKLPILKLGEYEMWVMRIKQYFQVQDYALWEVIENGNSWVSVPQTTQENGVSVTKMSIPVTVEEKINKKNDVKARSLLLMSLPNEHQLTFSQYPYAKSMFAAIETRFGGNAATKKTHKALLKQQYANFNASSTESLDSIFNRLQKLVSRLAILGVVITQEDLNSKFFRSLLPEWNTHVVVWMNKDDIETMGIDDLYNNFKIVEQNVKKSVGASTGSQNMAFMTTPSTSSTNDEVSTASTKVNTASPKTSFVSISNNVVYAFMVENHNGSNLLHQDLEQIHEDDLKAIDLKWQLSLLSMRAKRYFQKIRKKIFINGNDTAGYDKTKQGNNKDTSSKAMLAIDGVGFDWSDMAEEQIQTNMALMAFLDLELNETKFKASTYKRGLATVKEQLVIYRKNEVLFSEEVAVLKREVACKEYEINVLKSDFKKVKQEKDDIDFKIEKYDNASKSLDKLLESQITDKSKKGLGYNIVPPPHPLIYNGPSKLDLSYSGLDEFKESEFEVYGPRNDKQKSNINCDEKSHNSKENTDDSLEKEQVLEDENSSVDSPLNTDNKTVFHTAKKVEFVTPKNNEKPVRKSVRYLEMYISHRLRGNQRNWNGMKSNQLGNDFVMYNKACFVCESFNHLQYNCTHHQRKTMVTGNNYNRVDYDYYAKTIHLSTHRSMPPRAVLLKTGLKPVNTARLIYTAHPKQSVHYARTMTHFSKQAQSTFQRPFYKKTALTNRPTRPNGASLVFKRQHYIDAWGMPQMSDKGFVDSRCSRHMTGNIAHLLYFQEFDRGYVTFGGGAYGGRITGKGTLKTDNIDFEDVYFVNELKFNLFSVS